MRKLLLFVVSIAMIVGGIYWLADVLLHAERIYGRVLLAGAMLITVGSYLLWVDFIAPKLGIRTWEK